MESIVYGYEMVRFGGVEDYLTLVSLNSKPDTAEMIAEMTVFELLINVTFSEYITLRPSNDYSQSPERSIETFIYA